MIDTNRKDPQNTPTLNQSISDVNIHFRDNVLKCIKLYLFLKIIGHILYPCSTIENTYLYDIILGF